MDTAPTPTFQLSLLGRFELARAGGPIDLTSKKLAGLLAFLACTAPQAAQPRQAHDPVVGLAFRRPGTAEPAPGPHPAAPRPGRRRPDRQRQRSVSLRPGAIACDVARFEALLRDGSRDALDAAVGLYRGVCWPTSRSRRRPGRNGSGVQRQRLESLALDAMVKLGEQELAGWQSRARAQAANRAIAISSLREDAHRLVMRALAAGGRRADALKHYEDFAALSEARAGRGARPERGRRRRAAQTSGGAVGRSRGQVRCRRIGTGCERRRSCLSPIGPRSPCCPSPT